MCVCGQHFCHVNKLEDILKRIWSNEKKKKILQHIWYRILSHLTKVSDLFLVIWMTRWPKLIPSFSVISPPSAFLTWIGDSRSLQIRAQWLSWCKLNHDGYVMSNDYFHELTFYWLYSTQQITECIPLVFSITMESVFKGPCVNPSSSGSKKLSPWLCCNTTVSTSVPSCQYS